MVQPFSPRLPQASPRSVLMGLSVRFSVCVCVGAGGESVFGLGFGSVPEVCVVLVVSAARDTSGKNTTTHLNVELVLASDASAWEHV